MNSDDLAAIPPETIRHLSKLADADIVPSADVPAGHVRDETTGQIIPMLHWLKRMEKRAKKQGVWAQMRGEIEEMRERFGVRP